MNDGTIILETKIDEGGINSGISKIKSGAAKLGKTFAVVGAAATAAFAAVSKSAIDSYADYEQLTGGVETLFKTSSDTVMDYANQAYKTAGMSANMYMETVTSFSASLLQSLGGDTAKAAEYGNQAVIDMSDNANKMGTDMQRIQDAYQGFAKQNFTMLDNLKLGYGGTKTEMERLLAEAEKLKAANGEMASYSIDSFADITEAIHVVQENMGITGTTAKEAATTIRGSIGMMKAAWQNLLAGMADSDADIEDLMGKFIDSVEVVFDNLAPVIETTLGKLPTLVSKLGGALIKKIPGIFKSIAPVTVSSVSSLIKAIINTISANGKQVGSTVAEVAKEGISAIVKLVPSAIEGGAKLIGGIITGMQGQFPVLTTTVGVISSIFATIKVAEIVTKITSGFQAIQTVLQGYQAACAASQHVSILLASTMTPLQMAVGVLTGKVELATVKQVAWNAVMNLNPAVLITTAIVGLTAAVVGAAMAYDSYIEKHSSVVIASQAMADAAGQAAEKAQQLNNSLTEFSGKAEDLIADAAAEAYSNSILADELYNLAEQTQLTADQKNRMKIIIDDLNGSVDGLNLMWDENAGMLNMSRDALQEYINKSYEMAQAKAVQELYTETLKTQYEAQLEAAESSEKLNQATADLDAVYSQVAWTYRNANGEVVALAGATKEQTKQIDNLYKSIGGYEKALETSNNTVSEAEAKLRNLHNIVAQTDSSFAKVGQTAQTAEGSSQNLSATVGTDLPQSFNDAGQAADTSFKGIQQSADTTFESVKNGASNAATSAPGLGNDFGDGYARGILARKADAWAAGFALGMAAKEGTQTAQNSASPSKEAHKLGVDFDDGYILGIESETNEAEKAGEKLAESALKGAKNVTKNISEEISNSLKLLTDDNRSEVRKLKDEWQDDISGKLQSEEWYSLEAARIEVEREKKKWQEKEVNAKKSYEEAKKRAKNEIELQEAQAEYEEKLQEIHNEKMEQEQERAEDEYLNSLKERAEKERALYEAQQKDAEKLKKNIINAYNEMAKEAISDVEELQKTQESFAKKLTDYGSVFEERSYQTISGQHTYNVLADLSKQNKTLEKYYDALTKVKERENVPQEFFTALRDMSVDDGLEYATMLTKLSDTSFEKYINEWKKKQELSSQISKGLYTDEADALKTEVSDKFEEVEEEFFGVGETAADNFESGFLNELKAVVANIKSAINGAFANVEIPVGALQSSGIVSQNSSLNIPALASGGIVPRAMTALIGEKGKEAVLPLENNTGWMDILADKIAQRNGTQQQVIKEEHYNINQTELMNIVYKLAKGGERINGTSLLNWG